MNGAALLFWIAALGAAYPFLIYPLLVLALGRLVGRPVTKGDVTPQVSVLIPAHNEAGTIAAKLDNTLALDYPKDRLEILVCSDASTDGTDAIVRRYADRGVRLVSLPARGGKSLAQNAGLAVATGEVLVHTDATTILPPESLRLLVRGFADPSVGCITAHDRSVGEGVESGVEAAGLYTRFEIRVREAEAALGSLIGVSGSYYAVRRALRPPLAPDVIDDLYVPLWVVRQGLRVIAEPEAVGIVRRARDLRQEYRRRVRTFLTGMVALFRARDMLNPFAFGRTSFQLFSHKLARWLLPLWLAVLFGASTALAGRGMFYTAAFVGQCLVGILAAWGYLDVRRGRIPRKPARAAYFFAMVNVAILSAWLRLLRGRTVATWEPTRR